MKPKKIKFITDKSFCWGRNDTDTVDYPINQGSSKSWIKSYKFCASWQYNTMSTKR
jgi:hypothetical protein